MKKHFPFFLFFVGFVMVMGEIMFGDDSPNMPIQNAIVIGIGFFLQVLAMFIFHRKNRPTISDS